MAGPRYFGFVIGGGVPAAVAADWLTSTWDQNAGLYVGGPAAAVVEEAVRAWMIDLLGLPRGSSFGLVTGCQMAHFTCLAAARHAVLERVGWAATSDGLFGAPPIEVIAGAEAHATIFAALQYLGLGRNRVRVVAADEQGRMRPDAFRAELTRVPSDRPVIVCLQAGNVNSGSFDPVGDWPIRLTPATAPGSMSTAPSGCGHESVPRPPTSSPAWSAPTHGRRTPTSG